MNVKMKLKIIIDFLMTLSLIMLMAYQVTGEMLHEWLGVFMAALFIAHNLLDIGWYGRLFKGKYKPLRILQTVINFALLTVMFSLAYSGVLMSNYVFAFLPFNGGMAFARLLHLTASYWCLALVGIHLGFHWSIVIGIFEKLSPWKKSLVLKWSLRLFAAAVAGYGVFCFWQAGIISYMLLKTHFAFLDYEKNGFLVLAEYMAMMGLWAFISYYAAYGLRKLSTANSSKTQRREKQ